MFFADLEWAFAGLAAHNGKIMIGLCKVRPKL